MSSGPSSSSQITCCAVPSAAFRSDCSLLQLTRERPPETCLTKTVSAAFGKPSLLLTFPDHMGRDYPGTVCAFRPQKLFLHDIARGAVGGAAGPGVDRL